MKALVVKKKTERQEKLAWTVGVFCSIPASARIRSQELEAYEHPASSYFPADLKINYLPKGITDVGAGEVEVGTETYQTRYSASEAVGVAEWDAGRPGCQTFGPKPLYLPFRDGIKLRGDCGRTSQRSKERSSQIRKCIEFTCSLCSRHPWSTFLPCPSRRGVFN